MRARGVLIATACILAAALIALRVSRSQSPFQAPPPAPDAGPVARWQAEARLVQVSGPSKTVTVVADSFERIEHVVPTYRPINNEEAKYKRVPIPRYRLSSVAAARIRDGHLEDPEPWGRPSYEYYLSLSEERSATGADAGAARRATPATPARPVERVRGNSAFHALPASMRGRAGTYEIRLLFIVPSGTGGPAKGPYEDYSVLWLKSHEEQPDLVYTFAGAMNLTSAQFFDVQPHTIYTLEEFLQAHRPDAQPSR